MSGKTSISQKLFTLMLAAVLPLSATAASKIKLDTAEGYIQAQRKIQCSLKDGKEMTFVWQGRAYSRVPGERDKNLFNLLGMNVRQCITIEDEKRGQGYRLISREIMLYLDPKTGEIMRQWENPWSGKTVDVIHVANDPVNSRPSFGISKDGKAMSFDPKVINDTWFMNVEVPLFYTNPLAGDYQKYVGGTYHATEIFDFSGNYKELIDKRKHTAYANVAWVRLSGWLPWMEMGSRAGMLYFNATGSKLKSWNELPELIKNEIRANYPEYTNAPPADDARPNETSWTYMKKIIDSRGGNKAAPKGH
jgi:hypothetical protein